MVTIWKRVKTETGLQRMRKRIRDKGKGYRKEHTYQILVQTWEVKLKRCYKTNSSEWQLTISHENVLWRQRKCRIFFSVLDKEELRSPNSCTSQQRRLMSRMRTILFEMPWISFETREKRRWRRSCWQLWFHWTFVLCSGAKDAVRMYSCWITSKFRSSPRLFRQDNSSWGKSQQGIANLRNETSQKRRRWIENSW